MTIFSFGWGKRSSKRIDPKQAAQSFESVVKLVPESILRTDAQFLGGQAWFQAGECELAIRLYDQALERDPKIGVRSPSVVTSWSM